MRCDFSKFSAPEMTKKRPVLVLSPIPRNSRKKTCIIAALSTTEPNPVQNYHMKLTINGVLPQNVTSECWLKGDMIYSVSYERLTMYWTHKTEEGKRKYWTYALPLEHLIQARKTVAKAIGLHLDDDINL